MTSGRCVIGGGDEKGDELKAERKYMELTSKFVYRTTRRR